MYSKVLRFFSVSFAINVLFFGMRADEENSILLEKPIVIITASYNNSPYYQRNLDSIYAQNYTNYRLIHWDDCSSDGSGDLVAEYVRARGQEHRTIVIKNKERRGACANEYCAAHLCRDDEIIVVVDGDDWLAHPDVLKIVNETYQDPNVWLTYGQYEYFDGGYSGQCRELPPDCYVRHYSWVTSHLRTSYAKLFKKIKLEDFFFASKFLETTCDLAQMFPMLDMAGNHTRFIPTVLYMYNTQTPYTDHVINTEKQINMENYLRSKKAYNRLDKLFDTDQNKQVLSYDTWVIDFDTTDSINSGLEHLMISEAPYVLIIDKMCLLDEKEIMRACQVMHNTGAYGFYFEYKPVEKSERIIVRLDDNELIIAWQFGQNDIKPHQVGSLYRKEDIVRSFASINAESLSDVFQEWLVSMGDTNALGLCFGSQSYQAIDILIG